MKMWLPQVLVLGPGGIKGFLELGALYVLMDKGLLRDVQKYVGVSAGALISLLLCVGLPVDEICGIALKTNVFRDLKSINIDSIRRNMGILTHDSIRVHLEKVLIDRFGLVPTLEQLYMFTSKTLVAVASDLKNLRPLYFSYVTTPTLSCIDAVLMSMNIPVAFQKLEWEGSVVIDGAFCDPYPVTLFDDGHTNILGLSIINGDEEEESKDGVNGFANYIMRVLHISIAQLRSLNIEKATPEKVKSIFLHTKEKNTLGLGMTLERKSELFMEGHEQCLEQLTTLGLEVESPCVDGLGSGSGDLDGGGVSGQHGVGSDDTSRLDLRRRLLNPRDEGFKTATVTRVHSA